MASDFHPLEMHVHGDLVLNPSVDASQVHEALRPLWEYAGANSFAEGCESLYEEELGIIWNRASHSLRLCWTVMGAEDFRQHMEEACMNLNDLSKEGATLEVTFYDITLNRDEERESYEDSRDDFMLFFVGPTPAAIMQVQRDLLVQDVVGVMERHFEANELSEVVQAIDSLFGHRFNALVHSLEINRAPRSQVGNRFGHKPRHLH